MDLNLKGRTALVTGASKGIGLGVAQGLAAEGCGVHLVSRTEDMLKAAAEEITATHGVEATYDALDLSDSKSVTALTKSCPAPDILVNNAGAIPAGDIDATDEATWREAWDLKVFGYINMTRAYHAVMAKRGAGVIVNVVGMAGERPTANYIAGSAGNASLMAFTRALGGRSLDNGVRVVAVNPGMVSTDRMVTLMRTRAEAELGDAEQWQEFLKGMPLDRAAKVSEVADLVVFLASERASYISGTVVTLDGGGASRN